MNLPYQFTAGTKAKADEVNANFKAISEEVESLAQNVVNNKSSLQAIIDTQIKNLENTARPIGQPIFRLNNILYDDEIRLEGAEVSQTDYKNLYDIYGSTYGTAASGKFKLPDFRNRAVYGASGFGYLSAGLPNITGTFSGHDSAGGAFWVSGGSEWHGNRNNNGQKHTISFNASRSSSIYGASSTVQPPAIKVRVVTRYK